MPSTSAAELTELQTFSFTATDCPPPFSIHPSASRTAFIINNRSQCEIIQLAYNNHTDDEDQLKFQLSACQPSADNRPTAKLLPEPHAQLIRAPPPSSAAHLNDMMLDVVLLPQLGQPTTVDGESAESVYIDVRFCPAATAADADRPLIAGLSSFGALCVHTKRQYERRWTHVWVDLSAMWLTKCQVERIPPPTKESSKLSRYTFEQYAQMVRDVHLVAFAWEATADVDAIPQRRIESRHRLVAVSAAGDAVIFSVRACCERKPCDGSVPNAHIEFVARLPSDPATKSKKPADKEQPPTSTHSQSHRISHVQWLTTSASTSYMCTADSMGNIRMYTVTATSVTHFIDCVQTNVAMRIGTLQLSQIDSGSVVAVACTPSKVLFSIVPVGAIAAARSAQHSRKRRANTAAEATATTDVRLLVHSMPGQLITGCNRLSNHSYAICTALGRLQLVTLDASNWRGISDVTTIATPAINADKYQVIGCAATRRRAMWLFVLFPRPPFDHLVLRHPLSVMVCTNAAEADRLEGGGLLAHGNGEDGWIGEVHDWAEVYRFRQLKMITMLEYRPVGLDDVMAVDDGEVVGRLAARLRVHLMVLYGMVAHLRRRQTTTDELQLEITYILSTICAIMYYRRLRRMRQPFTKSSQSTPWTDSQRLTELCIRQTLRQYCDNKPSTNGRYAALTACLGLAFTELLQQPPMGETTLTSTSEQCTQCDAAVSPIGSGACVEGHRLDRCCISGQLLPIISRYGCRQCNAVGLGTIDALCAATGEPDGTVFRCPVCDVPLAWC